ncbi:hypothetical protein [Baekduia sp. Peel2402]|uniref:hypothetical protein n=1 Tax=Baekduia sp. Peel2402 TaxID=3458296 RepID=UPI00403EF00D
MRRILVVLAAAALVAPGGADARELTRWDVGRDYLRFVLTGTRVVGPVLAGDRVVWARGSSWGAWTIESAPGGRIARLGPQGHDLGEWREWHALTLAGSPTRLAYLEQFSKTGDKYTPSRLLSGRVAAGAPGAVPQTVVACHADVEQTASQSLSLAGDVLLYNDPCGGPVTHAQDLVTGASWSAETHAGLSGGAWTAGGVLAARETLYDAATGAVRGTYPPLGGERYVIDGAVQDDGTEILEVQNRTYPRTVVVRAPGDVAARVVPTDLPLVGVDGDDNDHAPAVRIVGGRIAVRVRAPNGAQQIAVGGLDGHLTPVVDFGRETLVRPAADPQWWSFDGTRIAWASQQCERVTIGVTEVGAGTAAAPEAVPQKVCARPRLLSKSARVDAHGRFTLRVACGAPCRDVLHLSYDTKHHNFIRFSLPGSTRPQVVHGRVPRGAKLSKGALAWIDSDPDSVLPRDLSLRSARASTARTP